MKFQVLSTVCEKVGILLTKLKRESLWLSAFLIEETFENLPSERDIMYTRVEVKSF